MSTSGCGLAPRPTRAHPEYDLTVSVAEMLGAMRLRFTHVENERACSPAQGAMRKRMGVSAGVPDFLIFDHPCVAIELKAGKGKASEAQAEWLAHLERCGWVVGVCRSMDEVLALLARAYPRRVA